MLKQSFYRADPLARLLLDRWRLTPVSFGLLCSVVTAALYLLVALISNTLVLQSGHGLLQDWLPWLWVLAFNPVVAGYYLWAIKAIISLIYSLERSEVMDVSQEEIEQVSQLYQPRWRALLALVIAVGQSLFFLVSRANLKNWTGSGALPALAGAIATLVVVYMGSMLVLTLITNVQLLHQVLGNKKLNINPLHPDSCGGLRTLSRYSLNTAYLAAVFGAMIGLIEYQFITQGLAGLNSPLHLLIVLYIVLSLACFFGPLLAAHQGMKEAKERLLSAIAKQFQEDYSRIQSSLHADAETLKKESAKIQELRSFYTLTNEFPVWPFDLKTFRSYLLSVTTPLIPPLIAIAQKLVSNALNLKS